MKSINYSYIIAFISFTVLATLGLQLYWNIKNYHENKAVLIQDVRAALDSSVDKYYIEQSKNNFFAFVKENDSLSDTEVFNSPEFDTVLKNNIGRISKRIKNGNFKFEKTVEKDENFKLNISSVKVLKGQKATDSISAMDKGNASVIVTFHNDSINLKSLTSILDKELSRKNIEIDYLVEIYKFDTIFEKTKVVGSSKLALSAFSMSSYLPKHQKAKILFSNPQKLILKRSSVEILLSLLLSVSTIFCLLFLLRIIKRQKKIDVIKNDLISNITHEFKTPITTISTAIEGIRNFNNENDKEKTNLYLAISEQQLSKLGLMVERLLETASLNAENLALKLESTDIGHLINSVLDKHIMSTNKEISFTNNLDNHPIALDQFHFENVLSNLIDNAIKYGGEKINITLNGSAKDVEIVISDDGRSIETSERAKIFEQFYRIPRGNIHNVKGFGIGLFYSKKIVEKHNGTLELTDDDHITSFKITLPNAT